MGQNNMGLIQATYQNSQVFTNCNVAFQFPVETIDSDTPSDHRCTKKKKKSRRDKQRHQIATFGYIL